MSFWRNALAPIVCKPAPNMTEVMSLSAKALVPMAVTLAGITISVKLQELKAELPMARIAELPEEFSSNVRVVNGLDGKALAAIDTTELGMETVPEQSVEELATLKLAIVK